jgi:hypothetical protein
MNSRVYPRVGISQVCGGPFCLFSWFPSCFVQQLHDARRPGVSTAVRNQAISNISCGSDFSWSSFCAPGELCLSYFVCGVPYANLVHFYQVMKYRGDETGIVQDCLNATVCSFCWYVGQARGLSNNEYALGYVPTRSALFAQANGESVNCAESPVLTYAPEMEMDR